jgi:hypothetical protein
MHIYHVASGTPVATILRPALTPKGTEVRTAIKHVTKRLRQHWRGDSHYGRVEAMEWAEGDRAHYIFGLAGNPALDALVAETADNLHFHHAGLSRAKLRTYASFMYQAGCWTRPRNVVARLECSLQPDGEALATTRSRRGRLISCPRRADEGRRGVPANNTTSHPHVESHYSGRSATKRGGLFRSRSRRS